MVVDDSDVDFLLDFLIRVGGIVSYYYATCGTAKHAWHTLLIHPIATVFANHFMLVEGRV